MEMCHKCGVHPVLVVDGHAWALCEACNQVYGSSWIPADYCGCYAGCGDCTDPPGYD